MKQHGIIATTMKRAFKIYLVPASRARSAVATATGGWSDLVAEARHEHEARKQGDVLDEAQRHTEPAVAASASAAPSAEPRKERGATSRGPTSPRQVSDPRTTGADPDDVAVRPKDEIEETSLIPDLAQPAGLEPSPSPTLVESGESSVEVRPNPAISPPHVTSGVIAHLLPEVRHTLAGNGPIRA